MVKGETCFLLQSNPYGETSNMDTKARYPERWSVLSSEEREKFSAELNREICEEHVLAGRSMEALARLNGRDDFLFRDKHVTDDCFVVHLTWRKESSPDFPWTTRFISFDDFYQNWKRIWD